MDLVNPDGEIFTGLSQAAHLARRGPILDIIVIFMYYLYIIFILHVTLLIHLHRNFLLDNIFYLPLIQHEHKSTFENWLHNLNIT